MNLPASEASNGAVGSGIRESVPFKSLTPRILEVQHEHRHKVECGLRGDDPDHAERTTEMWRQFGLMNRSGPRAREPFAEVPNVGPALRQLHGELSCTVISTLNGDESASGCQTSSETTVESPVTEPDTTVTSSGLPDPNQPDEAASARRTLTLKIRLRPVKPAERSGRVSKCREAAPLRSGPDFPAALTWPCLQPERGAVRIPDNGTTWARSHASSLLTHSGPWVRARPENTDP